MLKPLPYLKMEHEHVHSSADAAKTRGTKLEEAAKALVLQKKFKGDQNEIFMCVISGHRSLDMKKIKKLVGCKNIALADPADVLLVTGCVIGTVSPMPQLFGLQGYVDRGVLENECVVFSCASHHISIRMKSTDWHSVSGAQIEDIAKDEEVAPSPADESRDEAI